MDDGPPVTVERLRRARWIAAEVIRLHGPAYLPIFQRLQRELETMEKNEADIALAIKIAVEERDKYESATAKRARLRRERRSR